LRYVNASNDCFLIRLAKVTCRNNTQEVVAVVLLTTIKTTISLGVMTMKLVTGIVTSLVIGSLSFGVFAAQELEKDKAKEMNLTKVGEISTSDTTAPMDAKKELSQKADEMGGKYFVVTSANKDTKNVRATAEVFK